MMTSERLSRLPSDEREAWEASLSENEKVILYSATGHRYMVVSIAEAKWALLGDDLPPVPRLRVLEFLESCSDTFSQEAIAAVQPMPAEGREIVGEALKLGPKWLDVVARWEVFGALVAINPSLLTALKMRYPNSRKIRAI